MNLEVEFNRDYMELLYDFNIKLYADFCVKYYKYCLKKNRLSIFKQFKKQLFSIIYEDRFHYRLRKEFNYLFNTSFFIYSDLNNIQTLECVKQLFVLDNEPLDYNQEAIQDYMDSEGRNIKVSSGLLLSRHLKVLFTIKKFTLAQYNQVFKNTIFLSHSHLLLLTGDINDKDSIIRNNPYKKESYSFNSSLFYRMVGSFNVGVKDILTKKISLDDIEGVLKLNTKRSKIGVFFSFTIIDSSKDNKLSDIFALKWLTHQNQDVSLEYMFKLFDNCLNLIKKYEDSCIITVNGKPVNIDKLYNLKKPIVENIYNGVSNGYMNSSKFKNKLVPFTALKISEYNLDPIYKYIKPIIEEIEDDYLNLSDNEFSSIYNKNIKEFIEKNKN